MPVSIVVPDTLVAFLRPLAAQRGLALDELILSLLTTQAMRVADAEARTVLQREAEARGHAVAASCGASP